MSSQFHSFNSLTSFVVSMCQWIWYFRHFSLLRNGELTILVIFQLGYLTLHYFTVLYKSEEIFGSGFTVTASTLFISIHVCIRAPIGIDLWPVWSQRTRDKQQGRRVLEFPPLLHPHVKTPITHWFRSHNLISYTGKPLICRLHYKALFLHKRILNPQKCMELSGWSPIHNKHTNKEYLFIRNKRTNFAHGENRSRSNTTWTYRMFQNTVCNPERFNLR
jgi:hypothetical protein